MPALWRIPLYADDLYIHTPGTNVPKQVDFYKMYTFGWFAKNILRRIMSGCPTEQLYDPDFTSLDIVWLCHYEENFHILRRLTSLPGFDASYNAEPADSRLLAITMRITSRS